MGGPALARTELSPFSRRDSGTKYSSPDDEYGRLRDAGTETKTRSETDGLRRDFTGSKSRRERDIVIARLCTYAREYVHNETLYQATVFRDGLSEFAQLASRVVNRADADVTDGI